MAGSNSVLATELKRLARLGPFHWENLALARGLRGAAAVLLPLVIGGAIGHIEYGAYMALGALPAGFASFQGETRSRVAAVVLASLGMSVSTFVGATTAAAPWLLVPIVALWAYFAGLAVSLGTRASIAIFQWPVALLISMALPADPWQAALHAGFVLAGGLLHTVFVAASWTLRPGLRERTTLAASYRALADYAARLASGTREPPPAAAFTAHVVLDDPNPFLATALRHGYVDLLEEAERIRAALAALAAQAGDSRLADGAARILRRIAEALLARGAEQAGLVASLNEEIAALRISPEATWRWSGETLLGQLRAVVRILHDLIAPPAERAGGARATTRAQAAFSAALATLRANMTTTTEAGRHALRLAVVAALAEALVQATGLYQGRWAVLTVFIVLKPDYASTISRGAQRALGTAMGAALGGAAAYLGDAHLGGLIAAAGLLVAAAYVVFDVTYFLFSILITAFIVALLALLGMPAIATAEARILDTLLGAALALGGYLAWPTWGSSTAQETFARLIEAYRDYTKALLAEIENPGAADAALRGLQAAAGRMRSDAEAAAARLADEPRRGPMTPELARLMIATVARLAHVDLTLHALILSPDRPVIAAGDFSAALAIALERLATALRTLRRPPAIPELRPVEMPLRGTRLATVADALVDATNTLHSILSDRLPTGSRI